MEEREIKKLIRNDEQQLVPVIKVLYKLNPEKKYKLIDVGANGRHLEKFVPANVEYYSLDCSGKQDYIFDLDKGRMPVKSNSFDIVVCTETLEHVLFPHKVMKELLRIAKKDAIFLVSMPNEYNFWIRFQYLFNIKNSFQEAFKTTTDHLHIHSPRAKDVVKFFGEYLVIRNVYYGWHSHSSIKKGLRGLIGRVADKIIDRLAKIIPSLFSRMVVVVGKAKREVK